jgi:DNA-directed RNA polymerase subunit RPC12/RpoP
MSEFKYACPVCGQHIKCDSSQAGSTMECPTCFQKIVVPQAPASDDQKFILHGTKVGAERPLPAAVANAGTAPLPAPKKSFPAAAAITLIILICAAGTAAGFWFHGKNPPPPPIVSPPAQAELKHGAIGLGSWNTQVEYTNLAVTKGTQTLYQGHFVPGMPGWQISHGAWIATNGVLVQTAIAEDCRAVAGDTAWSDYTLTLQARKLGGREGFLIMFNVVDGQNWTWWNLGGWDNTLHAVENCVSGVKSTLGNRIPGKIDTGRWYDIRIELSGPHIRCYLDGAIVHDVVYPTDPKPAPSQTSSSHS